jgi:hypothetical protein
MKKPAAALDGEIFTDTEVGALLLAGGDNDHEVDVTAGQPPLGKEAMERADAMNKVGGEKEFEHHLSTNRILQGDDGLYYFSKLHLDEQYDLSQAGLAEQSDPANDDGDDDGDDNTDGKGGAKAKAKIQKDEAKAKKAEGKAAGKAARKAEKAAKKGEGKGKGKAKVGGKGKRKAAAVDEGESSAPVLKKPAKAAGKASGKASKKGVKAAKKAASKASPKAKVGGTGKVAAAPAHTDEPTDASTQVVVTVKQEKKEEPNLKKVYRGQMKSRTWRALLVSGALPESHKEAYKEAVKDGGGKIKEGALDSIIENGVARITLPNGRTRLEVVEHHPMFVKHSSRSCSTKHGQYAQGVILEEARTRCGTQAYLEEAINANRVKVASDGLYYFRSKHIGREDVFTKTEEATKNTEITDAELTALEGAIGDELEDGTKALDIISGQQAGGGLMLEIVGPAAFEAGPAAGGKGGCKVGAAAKNKLDEKVTTLDRTIKVGEKMRDQALAANLSSTRANAAVAQLMDTLEAAEISSMSNRFLLKFNKTQKGDPITTEMAEGNTKAADILVTDLIADVKTVNVHCKGGGGS